MSDIKKRVTAIQGIPVSSNQPTAGQVLKFDGIEWVPSTLSTFDPTKINGLQLWLRADMGVTQFDGGVSEWSDQSGIGDANRNVFQPISGQRPTYNSVDANYNDQPTLNFASASSQVLQSGTWTSTISEPYTIFVIGNEDNSGVAQDWIAASSNPGPVMNDNGSGYNWGLYNGTGLNGPASGGFRDIPVIFTGVFNGANSSISLNSFTPNNTGSMGTPIQLGALGVWVGAAGDYFHYLNGKIAEVIIYDSVLSSFNISNIYTYLTNRYNISIV